jgi:hypothetical protein
MLAAAALIALLAIPAGAQQAPQGTPARIRGTVEKLDGRALTVKSREGQEVTVTLAPNVTIGYLVKKRLADIKAGDFVASTSTTGSATARITLSSCASSRTRCAAWVRDNTPGTSSRRA